MERAEEILDWLTNGPNHHRPSEAEVAAAETPSVEDAPRKVKLEGLTLTELASLAHTEILALVKKAGGQRAFARKTGIPRTTLQGYLNKSREDPFGHRPAPEPVEMITDFGPAMRRVVRRFILTSAQDGTKVHEPFLRNLEAYVSYLNTDEGDTCELFVAGFTYNKSLFEDHSKQKVFWPESIKKYMRDERLRFNDRVDFCAEMNTLPTAVSPLSGFDGYTHDKWGIFPHPKVQLVSVPTMAHKPAKMNMTTGAVTMPNYVPKKAGLKAAFHHIIGAVILEMDVRGRFFCRHLIADEADGSFYDLDRFVFDGEVTTGHRARALTPGDVHVFQIDPMVSAVTFGMSPTTIEHEEHGRVWEATDQVSIVDRLRPEYLFIHDVCDFRVRNHHSIADPLDRFRLFVDGTESVEDELKEVAFFLSTVGREDMQTVVVESNHDLALKKWLNTADYRHDPVNALFFLRCQTASYEAVANRVDHFSIFEHVMKTSFAEYDCQDVVFLREDDTFVVDGVEMANHGHNGANGSRGNIKQFSKVASKVTIGHSHSAGINDGAVQTGTSTKMKLGYNKGPGSWSWSHALQYQNGKRTLLTIQDGLAYL
ncbi:DNA transfer protein [Caulobacter phage CcrBL9]|uniref:A1 protein n=1 Tax=Caulobacter phage CcrBL9 TaxID=2283270 RepID=A0A385EC26_9CAUD|nr:DNA transfer protein [Caulobacter phage CcrBL9]AXQ69210.1 hypothetical protein CcrBL9_gp186 [Caulobacter phage CcrBL9]